MAITELFAGIAVSDFATARESYERLIGRPPDLVPHDAEAAWRLAATTGWIYVVADADRAGTALATVLVDDLSSHLGQLADRGIAAGPVETMPGAAMRAVVTDPDGNEIAFGQPLG